MELETIGTLAKVVGYVGVIGGGAWTLWKKALKPMFDILSKRYQHLNAIPSIQENLKIIADQLVPNGGSSLRDAVDRLEANQVLMGRKQGIMLETGRIMILTMDPGGSVVDVSEPLCDMLDRNKEDLLGNNWISAVHPDDRLELEEQWNSAIDARRNMDTSFRFMVDGERECVGVVMKASALPAVKNKSNGYLAVITRK